LIVRRLAKGRRSDDGLRAVHQRELHEKARRRRTRNTNHVDITLNIDIIGITLSIDIININIIKRTICKGEKEVELAEEVGGEEGARNSTTA